MYIQCIHCIWIYTLFFQVAWNILGPNSMEVLPTDNSDFREPVNGVLHFLDGETGLHFISLQVLPHEDVEVEETFVLVLHLLEGESDIDSRANKIQIVVSQNVS